jgi:hypothetical protein
MGKNWVSILKNPVPATNAALNGGTAAPEGAQTRNAAAWNIPDETVQKLEAEVNAADAALAAAKNEESRTPVATAQCKTAFDALEAVMRDIKKRFFYVPPLRESDLVGLGLRIPDSNPSSTGTPTAQTSIETFLIGRHQLGVRVVYLTGSPSDPANKGYRIWYMVVAPGEKAPTNPVELNESFYTKRRKDVLEFDFEDSGKTAYFAVQVENEGKKGPWGPITSALIP